MHVRKRVGPPLSRSSHVPGAREKRRNSLRAGYQARVDHAENAVFALFQVASVHDLRPRMIVVPPTAAVLSGRSFSVVSA